MFLPMDRPLPIRCRCICDCRKKLEGEVFALREAMGEFWFNNSVCKMCYEDAMNDAELVVTI